MKTIIAGSRHLNNRYLVQLAVRGANWKIAEVVCGGTRGIDMLGKAWADKNSIPVKIFPADWRRYGRYAGPIRNQRMAEYADALIAVWDGKSPGTRDMIKQAREADLLVYVYKISMNKFIGELGELIDTIRERWPRCECGGKYIFAYDEPYADCESCHSTTEWGHHDNGDLWRSLQPYIIE